MKLSKRNSIIILFVFIIIAGAFLYYSSFDVQTLHTIVAQNYIFGVFLFISVYILAGITMIPISPLTMFASSLFPFHTALLYIVIGNMLGACVPFGISKKFGETRVHAYIHKKYPHVDKFDHYLQKNGLIPVIMARFVPFLPYSVFNYMIGLTKVPFHTYILGTFIGMLPMSTLYLYLGYGFLRFDPKSIAIALSALLFFSGLIFWYQKKIFSKAQKI